MRVGLVGTGTWAEKVHGAGAVGHPDVDLVGVWGRDPEKGARVAGVLGTAAFPSYDGLLAEVDAVLFAVPPDVQAPLALQAARAGKALLLEKPLALDVAVARELAAACADVTTALFVTRRWEPATAAWLADLAAQGGWDSGRGAFVAGLTEEFLAGTPWRVEHGALWDVGPHALSVLEAVLGPVVGVRATAGRRDLVQLLLEHEGGAVSTAELTLTAPPGAVHNEIAFWGAAGRSAPAPALDLDSVLAAQRAALTALVTGPGHGGPDAAYGLHVTEVLAAAATALG